MRTAEEREQRQLAMRSRIKQMMNADLGRSAAPPTNGYTVPELASLWRVSSGVVRKLISDQPGVVRTINDSGKCLRIQVPVDVARRVWEQLIDKSKKPKHG